MTRRAHSGPVGTMDSPPFLARRPHGEPVGPTDAPPFVALEISAGTLLKFSRGDNDESVTPQRELSFRTWKSALSKIKKPSKTT